MIQILSKKELFLNALQSSNFTEAAVCTCLEYYEANQRSELIRFMQKHKSELLEQLHLCQEQLDLLDYLIYKIKKSEI